MIFTLLNFGHTTWAQQVDSDYIQKGFIDSNNSYNQENFKKIITNKINYQYKDFNEQNQNILLQQKYQQYCEYDKQVEIDGQTRWRSACQLDNVISNYLYTRNMSAIVLDSSCSMVSKIIYLGYAIIDGKNRYLYFIPGYSGYYYLPFYFNPNNYYNYRPIIFYPYHMVFKY